MDIFNRKRVSELEKDLRDIESENDRLRRALEDAESTISHLLRLRDSMPEDCVPGTYCQACEFAKKYVYHNYVSGYRFDRCYETILTGCVCAKGEICNNFIQKKIEE